MGNLRCGWLLGMAILPAGMGPSGDPPSLGPRWGAIFRVADGDGDKILSLKVGGAGTKKAPRPVPALP